MKKLRIAAKTLQVFKIKFWLVILFCFFLPNKSIAQTYIQTRFGYVNRQFKALDPDLLNRDEHDDLGGAMVDVEFGKEFGSGRFTYLIGGRLEYNLQIIKGTYTIYETNPNVIIKALAPAVSLTVGVRMKVFRKFSTLFQASLGVKNIYWHQDGDLKEVITTIHLPLNIGLEYKLKNGWNLISGISMRPPVYKSQTYKYFFGIRKYL